MIVPPDNATVLPGLRAFTVRICVKVAPMARTAPWSAPVKTLSTARQLTGLASAKRAGEGRTVPPPALREPGAEDATPPATAPTGQNVILQMDPAPAQSAGRGRAVTNRARWARLGQAACGGVVVFMPTAAKLPPGSATVCQVGGVLAVVSHVRRACGGATVTRPASSTAPTVTPA